MHQQCKQTSTNPIASIFAWTRGLAHRGKLDSNDELIKFSSTIEKVCIESVENGSMTKDLAILIGPSSKYLTTNQFLDVIDQNLKKKLNQRFNFFKGFSDFSFVLSTSLCKVFPSTTTLTTNYF